MKFQPSILFESFDEIALKRIGAASGCKFSVRSLIFIIAGHEKRHLDILKEKYLA